MNRRNVLRAGFLGLAGLSLPSLLRARSAQAAAGKPLKDTNVILVWLGGGLAHQDSYDMKPDAPLDIRGEFNSISTNMPGLQICEHLPYTSRQMDKVSLLRSMTHGDADHGTAAHYLLTGYEPTNKNASNEMPSYGSIVAKELGARRAGLPAYVAIPEPPGSGYASYLGPAFNPFAVGGDLSEPGYAARDLTLPADLNLERASERSYLRSKLDKLRRDVDNSGVMDGLDVFHHRAFEMVSGNAAQQAFDLTRESDKTRDRYGRTNLGQSMLMARRLVEAGVTFVTVKNNGWDTHNHNFSTLKNSKLPELDQPFAALLEDVHERGMMKNTLIIQMGEFGRSWFVTPQTSGREHWPKCYSILVAGGGLKMGQVIGASDNRAAYPVDRPITPEDLLATLYQVLGVNPNIEYLNQSNRPYKILDGGRPIRELIG